MVGELYTTVSGTSQATPMASGTAALLLQANTKMTPAELKSRMIRGAHLLVGVAPTSQGAGLGDSYNTFISVAGTPIGDGSGAHEDDDPPRALPNQGCLGLMLGTGIIGLSRNRRR
jgi:subtilisin family serine protease